MQVLILTVSMDISILITSQCRECRIGRGREAVMAAVGTIRCLAVSFTVQQHSEDVSMVVLAPTHFAIY